MKRVSVAPLLGPGMIVQRMVVPVRDVVFVKGVVEAREGIAQMFAEHGGDLLLAAPASSKEALEELVRDLCEEVEVLLFDPIEDRV